MNEEKEVEEEQTRKRNPPSLNELSEREKIKILFRVKINVVN